MLADLRKQSSGSLSQTVHVSVVAKGYTRRSFAGINLLISDLQRKWGGEWLCLR